MLTPRLIVLAAWILGSGCDTSPAQEAQPAYLGPATQRRALLEDALWQPELPYSRSLLTNYGLGTSGWDLLPVMNTVVRPFTVADAALLAAGESPVFDPDDVANERFETRDSEASSSVGARVFALFPMRYDGYLSWVASQPERWDDYGVTANADGAVPGVVVYQDLRGDTRVGVSCAFCHGAGNEPGRASRELDLGRARGDYRSALGESGDRFYGWGPGRLDVTDDPMDSPTAIPDLWGLDAASYLNHSGVIRLPAGASSSQDRISTMAVRFETQYILGHRLRSRPPRDFIWALAEYVSALGPPASIDGASDPEMVARGAARFDADCATCHRPDQAYAGGLVAAGELPLDAAVAITPERGTGFYKVPSLLGVSRNAPYFHDGSAPSLEAVIDSGHPFGTSLPPDASARADLLAFLSTL